jgi:hypothetical protein
MSIALSVLVARLQSDVPANNGVPSAAQYEQAVKDALADFARRVPMQKVVTLNMVNGVATYALPDDFQKIIRVASLANPSGVIIGTKLIPVNAETWKERYTVAGKQITFYPTPTYYSIARDVWYAAGYMLDDSGQYPDLTDEAAEAAMLLAQSKVLMLIANAVRQNAWRYSIGDESVDKSGQGKEIAAQADALREQYLDAVKALNGEYNTRARYE